jgi:hypothetical protein
LAQSGTGLPHSKTLPRPPGPSCFRQVLECGSPVPLSLELPALTARLDPTLGAYGFLDFIPGLV